MPPLPKNKSQQQKKRGRTAQQDSKAKQKEKQQSIKNLPLTHDKDSSSSSAPMIPLDLQQLLLNIFKNSFRTRLESDIKPLLQEVKQHLYHRDFAAAFSKEEYLEAYAARWSPSRALNYLSIFQSLKSELRPFGDGDESGKDGGATKIWKVVCLGGGAGAEIMALGGFARMMGIGEGSRNDDGEKRKEGKEEEKEQEQEQDHDDKTKKENEQPSSQPPPPSSSPSTTTTTTKTLEIHTLDIANWAHPISTLTHHLTSPPPLSPYASTHLKSTNTPLVAPSTLTISFHQADILTLAPTPLSSLLQNTNLVTLMFTLNELYTTSVAQTQSFLLRLTQSLARGALLLVVDSPGSYSTVGVGGGQEEKKYPMQWLVDFTLLGKGMGKGARKEDGDEESEKGKGEKGERREWVKVCEEESRWFRLPDGLKYPIELENGRVQVHLYRRV